ncbi:ATP-binding protein [Actinocrinis sp.]|uniref:ATP-binding protein n=1 Tax=Actinocrinis sp. TaxID=1920516 RepID=UPI002D53F378|nr:tetratricopeptide repeat protein [Actinocrinis sp.]HZP54509.1 tetratricopeptide repeat protein [Actinocrinis sp.]
MTPAAIPPSEPAVTALGTVLRRLRRGRGLAQRDLLQPLHLGSHSAIVDYEAGRRIPPEAVIEAYERFFNLAPGTLTRMREQALAERAAWEASQALLEQAAAKTVPTGMPHAAAGPEASAGVSSDQPAAAATPSAQAALAGRPADAASPSPPPPRQLPASIEHFTGRSGELVRLDRLLRESDIAVPVVISAVNGMGGIGKTTLAVHWAHQARDSFPDGELYIDLQGFHPSGHPVSPEDAIGRFLTALGVPEERMPASLDARTVLYRTLMTDRRMLVLLDNARDTEQIRPLLPASPHCRVLITSRSRLSGLAVREGVQRISLETLTLRDAIRLLRRTIGARAVAEPGATAALAELCARHPLSLRIAAERIAGDETMTVTDAVAVLSVASNRLSELSVEDDETAAIRTVFGWSYQTLPSPAQRLFRLLGLHDGPDLPLAACASLSGLGSEECTAALARLTDSNLAEEHTPGRFRLHDLLRLFAHERALVEDSVQERATAITGLVDWYVHSACIARVTLDPHLPPLEPPPARLVVPAQRFADEQAALAWCELERQNLTAVSLQAQQFDLFEQGWKLPTAMFPFFDRRNHYGDWIATHKSAAECAHQLGDLEAEGKVLCNLGSAYRPMRRFDEAVDFYERAIVLMREAGWRTGEAKVLGNLAATHADADRIHEAITVGLQSLALFEELEDAWGQALCLSNLGNSYARLGQFDEALRSQTTALEVFRELKDQRGISRAVNGIGTALARLSRPQEALGYVAESVRGFAETGDVHEEANALRDLAEVYRDLGQPQEAAARLREASRLFEALGEHWMVAELNTALAALMQQ